jgi:D-3-phosphoglycerate dehydrogenase
MRILVTPRSLTSHPPLALSRLRDAGYEVVCSTPGKTPDEAELVRLLPGCVGWLAGVEPVSQRAVAAADALRVISRNGSGVDNLPLALLAERGVRVARADGANSVGVAELALAMITSAVRHLPDESAGIHAGGWPRLRGREINGSVAAVVGMGAIGSRVAQVLQIMGAAVLAHDPFQPAVSYPVTYLPLADALSQASIVTLHCPALGDRPLIGVAELASMPRGSVLVNTARASLVDEAAIIAALESGQLATYATDVFGEEPPRDRALAGHPRVIATSHIGGLTEESVTRATDIAIDNLLLALAS